VWSNRKFLVLCLCILLLNGCSGDDAIKPKNTPQHPAPNKSSPKTTSLTYADRKVWRAILQWPDSCETAFDSREGTWSGLTFWPIGAKQYLVEVQCFLAAYQPSNMYAWYDEVTEPPLSKFLAFTVYSSEDGKKIVQEQVTELAGLSEFNAEQKELWITTKSRGLGDCGSFAKYGIQNAAAILKEFRAKFECDGKWQEPKTYERLFPR
jgi:hypothetical protein